MPFETIQKDPAAFRLLPAAGGWAELPAASCALSLTEPQVLHLGMV